MSRPTCQECGTPLWNVSCGWVCPEGHGRILGDWMVGVGRRAALDVQHDRPLKSRLRDVADGLRRLRELE